MKDFLKNKLVTGLVVAATVILAGVAIFTALRLYQLRKEAVAPTAPESKPKATGLPKACTQLTFTITGPTGTPTPTPKLTLTPTSTPKATPTPTTPNVGGGPSPTPTLTSTPTPTQPPGATSTPTPTPTPTTGQIAQASPMPGGQAGGAGAQLPAAGFSLPTILIMGVGILLIIGAVLLAI